jgi:hypothetical protein
MLIDMLRTRGTVCPANGPNDGTIVLRSAGHLHMPKEFPKLPHRTLLDIDIGIPV